MQIFHSDMLIFLKKAVISVDSEMQYRL